MRRIVTSAVVTLDGFMEGPGGAGDLEWSMPFEHDLDAYAVGLLSAGVDAILLGRVTYEGFSGYWPFERGGLADLMNTLQKYVVTSPGSLADAPWGAYADAHSIDRDVEARLRDLKGQDGADMVVLASGGLASSLLNLGLVDEIQLMVVPVVLGAGKPYLGGVTGPLRFELADLRRYPEGSVRLAYRARR